MEFFDKIGEFCFKAFNSLGAITDRLDTTSWAVVSVIALVAALIFLKGDAIKGA